MVEFKASVILASLAHRLGRDSHYPYVHRIRRRSQCRERTITYKATIVQLTIQPCWLIVWAGTHTTRTFIALGDALNSESVR